MPVPKRRPAALLAAVLATGCASAQVVHRDRDGGTLSLHGEEQRAYDKAYDKMEYHCNGPFHIVEEGEVVVGTETVQVAEEEVREDGTIVEEERTTTRDVTEWHVTYECLDDEPSREERRDGE